MLILIAIIIFLVIVIQIYMTRIAVTEKLTLAVLLQKEKLKDVGVLESIYYGIEDTGISIRRINFWIADTDGTPEKMTKLVNEFQRNYSTGPRMIICNYNSDELMAAANAAPDVLCLSLAASASQPLSNINTVSGGYSTNLFAYSVIIICKKLGLNKIVLISDDESYFIRDYRNEILKMASNSDLKTDLYIFDTKDILKQKALGNQLGNLIIKEEEPCLISYVSHQIYFDNIFMSMKNKQLPRGTTVICNHYCSTLKDEYGDLPVLVGLNSPFDYTERTRNLFKRLIGKYNYTNYLCPVGYDFGFRIGMIVKNRESINRKTFCTLESSVFPLANFSGEWINPKTGISDWCSINFVYTKMTPGLNINEFRKESVGNVPTLPDSSAAPFWVLKVPWGLPDGWIVYTSLFERYFYDGVLYGVKLSRESRDIKVKGKTVKLGFSPRGNPLVNINGDILLPNIYQDFGRSTFPMSFVNYSLN